MAYVKNSQSSYGGLSRAWGLGAAGGSPGSPAAASAPAPAPTPSTSGAVAVAAGPGVIAAPQEATRTYYPGSPYGYPGYGFPGYPGYPMTTVPTVMAAPPPVATNGNGSGVAVMKLPTFVVEDKRRMFKRPRIRPQLARLGTVAALVGVGLLLT